VLATDSAWTRYSVPISAVTGSNTISIRIASVYSQCEFTDPVHSNVSCPSRVYVRQAASSWGWDWVKRYSPVGVWRPIFLGFIPHDGGMLTGLSAVVRGGDQTMTFTVDVAVNIKTVNGAEGTLVLSPSWLAAPYQQQVKAPPGDSVVQVQLQAKDVHLWWPAGYGDPVCYNLTASFAGGQSTSIKLGFRSVRLQTDSGVAELGESEGSGNSSMNLLVNGVRLLVRGSSFVPMDSFSGRLSGARVERLMQSVLAANMNALRVWGGGDFLPPFFYDLADSYGILILHDYMLTWYPNVPYPAFPEFTERIVEETTHVVTALAHHPSIVLWFGNNEDMVTKDTHPHNTQKYLYISIHAYQHTQHTREKRGREREKREKRRVVRTAFVLYCESHR